MVEVYVGKKKSFGDVLLVHFCGVFGKKGIVRCVKISASFDSFWGIQLLGGAQITPNYFVIIALS